MSFYKYQAPSSWQGYRDIDEPIDIDKINMENFVENGGEVVEEEDSDKGGKKAVESTKAAGKKK